MRKKWINKLINNKLKKFKKTLLRFSNIKFNKKKIQFVCAHLLIKLVKY